MQDVSREQPPSEGQRDSCLAWSHGPVTYPVASGDGSKVTSQSRSTGSSVVLSPHDGGGGSCIDMKSSSTSNSSSSSSLLKEHDYIGLAEVSSSSVRKQASEDEKFGTENVNFNFAETDLRLGLGPPEATDFSSVEAQLSTHASKFASQGSASRAQGLPCLALGSICHEVNHGDRGWVSEQKKIETSEMPAYTNLELLSRNTSSRAPTQVAQNGSRTVSAWPERSYGLNEGTKMLHDERAKPEGQLERQMAPDSRASQELHYSSQMGSWSGRDGRLYVNETGPERRSHVFPDTSAASNHRQAPVLRSTKDAPAPQQSGQDFDSARSVLIDAYAGSRLVLQPSRNGVKRGYSEAMADTCFSSGELRNGVCDGAAAGNGAQGATAVGAFTGVKGGMQLSEIEVKQLSQSVKHQPTLYPLNWSAVKPTSVTPWQMCLEHNGGPLGPFGCLQSKHSGPIPKHLDTAADAIKAAWDSRENAQEGFRSLENPQSQAGLMENQQPLHSDAPPSKGQVVGWPPIRSFRKNTLAAHPKPAVDDDGAAEGTQGQNSSGSFFVKVNMDGVPIGRKLDLNAYSSYDELSHALEDMFQRSTTGQGGSSDSNQLQLHNGSEYTLTYEDKDGDWMLVGDVPWGMFVNTVRRLRIMKGSDATGLAPRGSDKSKCHP